LSASSISYDDAASPLNQMWIDTIQVEPICRTKVFIYFKQQ